MNLKDTIIGGLVGGTLAGGAALSAGGGDAPAPPPQVPSVTTHAFCDGHPGWTAGIASAADAITYYCRATIDGVEYIMYLREDGTPSHGDNLAVPGDFLSPSEVPTWDAP